MNLKTKKGLNIPLSGYPQGKVNDFPLTETIALDFNPFETLSFSLLKKEGDLVKLGEPIAIDKKCPERVFVSPGSGKIIEVNRGLKRRLLSVVIETDQQQTPFKQTEGTLENLIDAGLYPHIQMRPCLRIAHPKQKPEAIFIRAIASAPFVPPPELEINGHEEIFSLAVEALSKLCPIHLVYREGSDCKAFTQATHAEVHSASGPHPIGNASVHIQAIHPIKKNHQVVWTLSVSDVVSIGKWLKEGVYYPERVISVAGEGIPEGKRGYYRVNRGVSIEAMIGKLGEGIRVISGDPLTGEVSRGHLGFYDTVICAFPEPSQRREFLHFLKFKRKGYTASKAYFFRKKSPGFTTLQHGEVRPFVDGSIYDKVMPLKIETMPLIKTLLTEQYDKGEALGLLEVAPEDFALAAFVCPSKIEMPEIVKQALQGYASQYFDD